VLSIKRHLAVRPPGDIYTDGEIISNNVGNARYVDSQV